MDQDQMAIKYVYASFFLKNTFTCSLLLQRCPILSQLYSRPSCPSRTKPSQRHRLCFFTRVQQSNSRHPLPNPTNLDRVRTSNRHVFSRLTVFRRLKEFKDTVKLIIFTLDIATPSLPLSKASHTTVSPSSPALLPWEE